MPTVTGLRDVDLRIRFAIARQGPSETVADPRRAKGHVAIVSPEREIYFLRAADVPIGDELEKV